MRLADLNLRWDGMDKAGMGEDSESARRSFVLHLLMLSSIMGLHVWV